MKITSSKQLTPGDRVKIKSPFKIPGIYKAFPHTIKATVAEVGAQHAVFDLDRPHYRTGLMHWTASDLVLSKGFVTAISA